MEKLLRVVGLLEALSCVGLFGIAIPLKYFADNGEWIRSAGMTHGIMFLAFLVLLLITCQVKKWSLSVFVLGLVAAIVPLGTLVFDRYLARLTEEQ